MKNQVVGCGGRAGRRLLMVLGMALMSVLTLPCVAKEAVQTAAKAAQKNVTGGNLGTLYKARIQASTPERREMVVKACVAGLYAIGDLKSVQKIRAELKDADFIDSLKDDCSQCSGSGTAEPRPCSKCKGSGKCPNSKCNNGMTIEIGFNGYRRKRNCSICGGSGGCPSCKGKGEFATTCSRCRGAKRVAQKETALAACKELLASLSISEKERKAREKAEEEARLAKEKAEQEARLAKEKAEQEARLAKEEAEREKREREAAERTARTRKELAEKIRMLSALPSSSEGWSRGVTSGDNGRVYVERVIRNGGFKPVLVRVFAHGDFLLLQTNRDDETTVVSFLNIRGESLGVSALTSTYDAFIALRLAAKKAEKLRGATLFRQESDIVEEIRGLDLPVGLSYVERHGAIDRRTFNSEGRIHFKFGALTGDGGRVHCLHVAHGFEGISIDLLTIDTFLKEANPIGAFEVLQKNGDFDR